MDELNKHHALSLLELNRNIKQVIKETKTHCWIIAEISELKVNYSGHCYLELVEKDAKNDQIVARSKATIWANTFRMVKPYFETTTGQILREGLGVMIRVIVDFHEVYGLSLNVTDIEPSYTVGELALRKQKIIERLREEGVLEMNKELNLPLLCRKIAVVSSKTAAGYEDFVGQLLDNSYGYKFYIKLFPAVMQGEEAERSIIAALDKIYRYDSVFDAVVIIRGGGSQADLSCFDNYWLAYHVTQFPIPVLTGIGHEQDDSVTDIVAHTRLKTPTAVAVFLIDQMVIAEDELNELVEKVVDFSNLIIDESRVALDQKAREIHLLTKETIQQQTLLFSKLVNQLSSASRKVVYYLLTGLNSAASQVTLSSAQLVSEFKHSLDISNRLMRKSVKYTLSEKNKLLDRYRHNIQHLDPLMVLKRGYSITLKDGNVVKNDKALNEGDLLESILSKGKIYSIYKKK